MGTAAAESSSASPVTPTAFLISSEQPTSVSMVSANIPPTTGTKLSTAYLAARMLMPSAAEAVSPCNDVTPRKTVKATPSSQLEAVRSSPANRDSRMRGDR